MLRKKESFTVITPIPSFIPRQLAIDILHSHSEVITLNPLVLDHKAIKAPRDAAADEYYSTWYEITERIQYVPGLGRMGSGKISFNGCFHNLPWGLQTHVYAPMNTDLRNKYRIAGNQSGYEPAQPLEMGLRELGAPADGLYLHEDIEIKCNIAAMGFVKAQLKTAGKEMVSRIIKKAELLDAGVLQAMIEDGRLKTYNPADRSDNLSPAPQYAQPAQPSPTGKDFGGNPPMSPRLPYQVPRVGSVHGSIHSYRPGSAVSLSAGYPTPPPMGYSQTHPGHPGPTELPLNSSGATATFAMELPGDYYHPQASSSTGGAPSPYLQPGSAASATTPGRQSYRDSPHASPGQPSPDQPQSSRPASLSSEAKPAHNSQQQQQQQQHQIQQQQQQQQGQPQQPFRSPGLDHRGTGFASDLTTHRETNEEHNNNNSNGSRQQQQQQQPAVQQQKTTYTYNPQDYAKVPTGQQRLLPQQGPPFAQAQGAPYGYTQ